MSKYLIFLSCFVSSLLSYSQADMRPIVGVAQFTQEIDSKYSGAIAEKVVQVVTDSKRFTVVDRTSYDKVKEELEFQKSEAFIDSENTAKQDAALAAEYIIVGHIVKLSIYAMRNADGSINGYKASTAFILKVNDVETGKTTEAESFQTKVSPLMLSPESALTEALNSVGPSLSSYFIHTFPLTTRVLKVLSEKKGKATSVLIAGGKSFGFNEKDELIVERNEIIDGKVYPSEVGKIKISRMAGDDFSECNISKGGEEILSILAGGEELSCKLIIK